MSRTIKILIGFGAILMIGIGATPAGSQSPKQRTTIEVFDPNKTPYNTNINERSKKFGSGDWSVGLENFLDPETCERAGRAVTKFTFVKPLGNEDGYYTIDATILLPDGKITVAGGGTFGEFEEEDGAAFSVVGGTGAYQDATGQMNIVENQELCDRMGANITFSLLLD
jgi:allene oxide cyclase-like protein